MQTYIVLEGDTLFGISKQFGVSVSEIKSANKLDSNTIFVGDVLIIPTNETSFLYIVKSGDTLYSISKKYNVSVNEIMRVNNLTNNIIGVGEQLRIPINSNGTSDDYIVHTVKVGDNLYSISRKYGVSVDSIKNINNLNSDLLSIGQKLRIPNIVDSDDDYFEYVVKKNDTLYSIAKKFNMSVNELMRINNLETTALSIGQVLNVINNSNNESNLGMSCYGEGYVEPRYELYTVVRGDSLYSISRKFNVSIDSLRNLNNLTNDNLDIGDVLKIREVI